jgi:hypothetical protein
MLGFDRFKRSAPFDNAPFGNINLPAVLLAKPGEQPGQTAAAVNDWSYLLKS